MTAHEPASSPTIAGAPGNRRVTIAQGRDWPLPPGNLAAPVLGHGTMLVEYSRRAASTRRNRTRATNSTSSSPAPAPSPMATIATRSVPATSSSSRPASSTASRTSATTSPPGSSSTDPRAGITPPPSPPLEGRGASLAKLSPCPPATQPLIKSPLPSRGGDGGGVKSPPRPHSASPGRRRHPGANAGPGIFYVLTRSLKGGRGEGVASALGTRGRGPRPCRRGGTRRLGDPGGVGHRLQRRRSAGAAYLLYLGLRTLLSGDGETIDIAAPPGGTRRAFWQRHPHGSAQPQDGALLPRLHPRSSSVPPGRYIPQVHPAWRHLGLPQYRRRFRRCGVRRAARGLVAAQRAAAARPTLLPPAAR